MFTHSGLETELGQVVSWGELPGVLQVETHCTGVTLCCGGEVTKCTLCKPHWTVIDLETSDRERSGVEREVGKYMINAEWKANNKWRRKYGVNRSNQRGDHRL